MPTFIDRHLLSAVPGAIRYQMHREAVDRIVDRSGAVPVAHWIEDGVIYCLLQSPDRQAVCSHHARLGLGCGEVHPIHGLREARPTSRQDQALVRAAIEALWHHERPPTPGNGTSRFADGLADAAVGPG